MQTYLWAIPALNMYGMKEGSEKVFGAGYNVLLRRSVLSLIKPTLRPAMPPMKL